MTNAITPIFRVNALVERGARAALTGRALAIGLGLIAVVGTASADGYRAMVKPLDAYTQECAACHMAYSPGLLPAASWQRLMKGLDKHFGTNASLDDATVAQISTWLTANAAQGKRSAEPAQERITQTQWFVRHHRQFSQADWAHPQIKTAANCVACHVGAERRGFDEDNVRLPAGVGRSRWLNLLGDGDDERRGR
jgi:mono/diheme cytochrome c family protein